MGSGPQATQKDILEENHSSGMASHFAVSHLYAAFSHSWWWEGMYSNVYKFCHCCPQCATATGGGRKSKPPLHPIPVQRPFQIIRVDVLELPKTENRNKFAIVFQDFLTKWPMAQTRGQFALFVS